MMPIVTNSSRYFITQLAKWSIQYFKDDPIHLVFLIDTSDSFNKLDNSSSAAGNVVLEKWVMPFLKQGSNFRSFDAVRSTGQRSQSSDLLQLIYSKVNIKIARLQRQLLWFNSLVWARIKLTLLDLKASLWKVTDFVENNSK